MLLFFAGMEDLLDGHGHGHGLTRFPYIEGRSGS